MKHAGKKKIAIISLDVLIAAVASMITGWYYYWIQKGFPAYGDDLSNVVRYNLMYTQGRNFFPVNFVWDAVSWITYGIKGLSEDTVRLQAAIMYSLVIFSSIILVLILKKRKRNVLEKWSFLPFFMYLTCLIPNGISKYFGFYISDAVVVYPFNAHMSAILFAILTFILIALVEKVQSKKIKYVLICSIVLFAIYSMLFTDSIYLILCVGPILVIVIKELLTIERFGKMFPYIFCVGLFGVLLIRIMSNYIPALSFLNDEVQNQYGGVVYGISNWGAGDTWLNRVTVCVIGILGVFNCQFFDKAILNIDSFSYIIRVLIICLYVWVCRRKLKRWCRRENKENRIVIALILGCIFLCLAFVLADFGEMIVNIRYLPAILPLAAIVMSVELERVSVKLRKKAGVKIDVSIIIAFALLTLIYVEPVYTNEVDNSYDAELDNIAEFIIENELGDGIAPYWAAYNLSVKLNNQNYVDPVDYNGYLFEMSASAPNNERQAMEYNYILVANYAEEYKYRNGFLVSDIDELFGSHYVKHSFGEFDLYYFEDGIKEWSGRVFSAKENSFVIKNGEVVENFYHIQNDGMIYGPYISLGEGTYTVEVYGENLLNAIISVTTDIGSTRVGLNTGVIENNMLIYTFVLDEDEENVEFPIYNPTNDLVIVEAVHVIKNAE